MAQTDKTLAN